MFSLFIVLSFEKVDFSATSNTGGAIPGRWIVYESARSVGKKNQRTKPTLKRQRKGYSEKREKIKRN